MMTIPKSFRSLSVLQGGGQQSDTLKELPLPVAKIQAFRIGFQIFLALNILCPILYWASVTGAHTPTTGDLSEIIHQIFP